MRYPVTRDPDNKTEIIQLDLEEVIFVDTGDRFVVFHTMNEVFYPVLPRISTLELHLEHLGFRRMDRTNLVNTNKIKQLDHDRALIFFDDQITKTSKFTTVSLSEKLRLKKLLYSQSRLEQKGDF